MLKLLWRALHLTNITLHFRLYHFAPYGKSFALMHLLFPWTLWPKKIKTGPDSCCQAFQQMGPLFVKIGQLCATRADLFQPQWIEAFSRLQDQMPPLPNDTFKKTFSNSFSQSVINRLSIDWEQPLACASLAQVYRATLDGTTPVVLKMRKNGVKESLEADLFLISWLLPVINFFTPKRLNMNGLFHQLKRTVEIEQDFRYEAVHADKFRRVSELSMRVPKIYQEFITEDILVMESFEKEQKLSAFLQNTQTEAVLAKPIARQLLKIVTQSLFREGFFHADLHPGNIFISRANSQLLLIDFGQVGGLSQSEHFYLCQLVAALLERDFQTIATLFSEANWAPRVGFDKQRFETDLEVALQPFLEASLEQVNIANLVTALIKISRRHQLQIQPGFLLAQKTILMAEGLARQLDPEIVPLEVFHEEILSSINHRYGVRAFPKHWKQQRWRLARLLLGLSSIDKEDGGHRAAHVQSLLVVIGLSLGWMIFITLSASYTEKTLSVKAFLVVWHMMILMLLIATYRRER